MSREFRRRRAIGAEVTGGGVHFRVWAPARNRVDVVIETTGETFALKRESTGHFSGFADGIGAGARYRFLLDGNDGPFPDPASRFQPEGPHGPSQIVDPVAFSWRAGDWKGLADDGLVIYEIHVGTYTTEGTFEAAARHLPELAELGVTLIEIMPIADFPGKFGWGYDGVNLWAPTRLYGTPDDLRQFVDKAHELGIGVILDVVYNHYGPDGNYLPQYSPTYASSRYENEWGGAVNFDDAGCDGVRELVAENAAYWIDEFRLDGLRLDATQQIFDRSPEHIITRVARSAREAARGRRIFIVAENETQDVRLIRPVADGGYGLDALVNDDFHHSARVALTGRREAYLTMHRGTPQELISASKWGFLYQGQWYAWQKNRRGTPWLGMPARHLVAFLENHDQVANSAFGKRLTQLASAADVRAATAFMLLAPQIPMLFQGQEFGASAPFVYFADHKEDLAPVVANGRREFLEQFPSCAALRDAIPDPGSRATFERCKIDHSERNRNAPLVALHRDLLALRRNDPCFSRQRNELLHGAVLTETAFLLRYAIGGELDRMILINFGREVDLSFIADPLSAPPDGFEWESIWSSESPEYGGSGAATHSESRARIAAHSTLVLRPRKALQREDEKRKS